MKRLFSLMVVALFGMSAMAQAVIKFEKTSINLGTFKEDKVQTLGRTAGIWVLWLYGGNSSQRSHCARSKGRDKGVL